VTNLDYCVDRFEYPNVPGELPAVMLSWEDSRRLCEARGARLCSEDEWTFACEGEAALPYPYGYDRYVSRESRFPDHVVQGDGCNLDVIRKGVHADIPKMMHNRFNRVVLGEIDRLWAGVPSGSRARCVSPFGVYDLTGNIEEWTARSPGRPHLAGGNATLKGGYWSPVESRCQPGNTWHGPGHVFYQTGFRCCANPQVSNF
jgi:formylglycine-generating enzyme required for sulfatase activity